METSFSYVLIVKDGKVLLKYEHQRSVSLSLTQDTYVGCLSILGKTIYTHATLELLSSKVSNPIGLAVVSTAPIGSTSDEARTSVSTIEPPFWTSSFEYLTSRTRFNGLREKFVN